MKAAVIGAGIAGIAAAIRLAVKGYQVTVYEKNPLPGGKISQYRDGDYRFDTGPSLFTLPELVEELFTLCGENPADWLQYERLEINCKYYFPDGTDFRFYHNKEKLAEEIQEKINKKDVDSVFKRLNNASEVYGLSAPVFLFSDFHKWSNFNTPPYKKIARKLYKLDFFRSMHQANASLFRDKRLIQLFDRYATYNGSNPWKAPATLNMIAHLENNIGAFFPLNGMYGIIESLFKLAESQYVHFRFNTRVERIIVKNKIAAGIETSNGFHPHDLIVSDSDVKYLANRMLPEHPLKIRLNRMEESSSAIIFYWGIKREFPELDLHNILFSGNYKEEFRYLAGKKNIYEDPTIYLFISSKLVPEDAPNGHENWFVMINAPANDGQDWSEIINDSRRHIIRKINRILHTNIESFITTETMATPLTIQSNTLSWNGALYGTASNSMFSAFLRHPNSLPGIRNLYFTGGSVHPGGGIPLCLASAKIVVNEIQAVYE